MSVIDSQSNYMYVPVQFRNLRNLKIVFHVLGMGCQKINIPTEGLAAQRVGNLGEISCEVGFGFPS